MNKLTQMILKTGNTKLFSIGIASGFWFGQVINPTAIGWGLALGSTIICLALFKLK